jgi:endonuclease/exonuclease/phosphatase family metal-dependent hydrolase
MTTRWRVVTWNVHGSASPDLVLIAAHLRECTPDVVALQEVRRHQARRLASMLGWRRRWTRKHHPYSPLLWWRTEGVAVLTPHSIGDAARTTLTPGVSTWVYRHRVLLSVTVRQRGRSLRVHCTHLSSTSTDERIEQARRVATVVRADTTASVVAGDLNTHPHDLGEIVREFHAAGLRDVGGDSTNPAVRPLQRLDMVLVPDAAVVHEQRVPDGGDRWAELSDHLPVLVEFELPD